MRAYVTTSLTFRGADDSDPDLHLACWRLNLALKCIGAWLWVARDLALSADARARLRSACVHMRQHVWAEGKWCVHVRFSSYVDA